MKKTLLIVCCLFIFKIATMAQLENKLSSLTNSKTTAGQTIYEVTGDEICRFSSLNLLDAISNYFPGMNFTNRNTNTYLFVVNGFVLSDPNSISLYDIEKIVFTNNNLNGGLHPFSRPGTFYITTKKGKTGKPKIQFNTQYNYGWNKAETNNIGRNRAHLTSNQLSVATGSKKLSIYTAAQWDYINQTIKRLPTPSDPESNTKSNLHSLRLFATLNYQFSTKLSAGITGNYSFQNWDTTINGGSDNSFSTPPFDYEKLNRFNYRHLGAFVNWQPVRHLHNRLNIEYARNKFSSDDNLLRIYSNPGGTEDSLKTIGEKDAKLNTYTLRNQLDYDIIIGKKIVLNLATIFTYFRSKNLESGNKVSGTPTRVRPSFEFRSVSLYRFETLNPHINFTYDSLLSVYGGSTYMLRINGSKDADGLNTSFYTGGALNLLKAFGIKKKLNSLELSMHYGDLTRNNAEFNFFGNTPEINPPTFSGFVSRTISPLQPNYGGIFNMPNSFPTQKLLAVNIQTGFKNNTFLIGIGWNKLEVKDILIIKWMLGSGPTNIPISYDSVRSFYSGYVSAKIIDKPQFVWNIRLSTVVLAKANKKASDPSIFFTDSYRNYKTQTGWQNNFSYKNWFLQTNMHLGTGFKYGRYVRTSSTSAGYKYYKLNHFAIPYMLLGYDFKIKNSPIFHKVSAFAHARNLHVNKAAKDYYQNYTKYAGLGLNVSFK